MHDPMYEENCLEANCTECKQTNERRLKSQFKAFCVKEVQNGVEERTVDYRSRTTTVSTNAASKYPSKRTQNSTGQIS